MVKWIGVIFLVTTLVWSSWWFGHYSGFRSGVFLLVESQKAETQLLTTALSSGEPSESDLKNLLTAHVASKNLEISGYESTFGASLSATDVALLPIVWPLSHIRLANSQHDIELARKEKQKR